MQIAPATAADGAEVKRLLEAASLPTADITGQSLEHFLVLRAGDVLLGAVGLDLAGEVAMLRSLVVADRARGKGLGRDLVAAAESLARRAGIRRLYLLTTTADAFFAARGYKPADRDQAPEAIRAMPQFRGLCPASSAFMTRAL